MAMVDVPPDVTFDHHSLYGTEADISCKISDDEAARLDLVTLIARSEWRHVIHRMQESPHEAKTKQTMTLDGGDTTSYPLHLAVSKQPPVRTLKMTCVGQALLDTTCLTLKIFVVLDSRQRNIIIRNMW